MQWHPAHGIGAYQFRAHMTTSTSPSRPAYGRWLIGVLLLAGVVAAALRFGRAPEAVVVSPEVREVVDLVVVSGRLRAIREAAVGSEIAGTVEEALVREGDRVEANQPLVRIGMLDYESQQQQAEAARATSASEARVAALAAAQAKRDLARAEELAKGGINAVADLETVRSLAERAEAAEKAAQARLAANQAAIEVLARQLAKRIVRAPFAGVVTRRSVEPGQSVVPGTALYLVAEMSAVEIYADTDETNVKRLRIGQPATVIAPAFKDQPFAAKLTQIGPRVDWERGVVGLRLAPEKPPAFLLPNMTVDVNIEVGRFPNAITLPASAVLRLREGDFVLRAREGEFTRQAVTIVGENPRAIALTGIAAGDAVAREAAKVTTGRRYRFTSARP
jgi:HlyD family secretion protein